MKNIIVIGGNHHNTIGVIRSLGYKGIKPIVILHVGNAKKPYVAYSRFIKMKVLVNTEKDVLPVLLRYADTHKDRPVVIACSDGASSILDTHRDELIDYFILPGVSIQGELTRTMDKEMMSELGRSIGFNVPQSWIVETEKDISQVEFPCISKPILSKDGQKSDVKICHNKEELISLLKGGSCYRYQIQKFIEKDFEYQLIGLSMDGGKELIIPGISRCIRPCPGTNTGFLHYISIDSFETPLEKCKEFIQAIGYSGLFSIEFLRDKTGKDYFLEMNFRNDGNSICVTASGINLPYIWYLASIGVDYREELPNHTFNAVYVMPEFDDFRNFVKTSKISFLDWLCDIRRTDKFMEFDSKDMKPFFVELCNIFGRLLKKL